MFWYNMLSKNITISCKSSKQQYNVLYKPEAANCEEEIKLDHIMHVQSFFFPVLFC